MNLTDIALVSALSESIRDAGEVPSGTLYAALVGACDLTQYEAAIRILKRAKLISEDPSHMLRWIGPTIGGSK